MNNSNYETPERIISLLEDNKIISTSDADSFNLNPNFLALFDSYLLYNKPAMALFLCLTAYCGDTTEHETILMSEAFIKILSTTEQYKYVAFLIKQEIHKD